ncbi:hypothetical protein B7494_g3749 [Chlorociboria aeruginascens]|nr:hypothetical protein B7494_g3749 [Chlorociboria aeruginascens]
MSGFDSLNQNVFGLVALIVSFVALISTVLQVLQQYFSSAEGYRRCAESVMGKWSKGTHRRFRLKEFRVEVVFETPVLFLSPPHNDRGPIPNRDIHYILGTDESCEKTRVLDFRAQQDADEKAIERVHTADDEKASWVTLLSTLQREERESRKWDDETRNISPPFQGVPYATTAICHLVEMMGMLGMYWRVFDHIQWNLRAEGNGFILTSTLVHGLGVMVVFAITGKSKFKENRVIPNEDMKQLCFGTVPNIFEDEEYLKEEKDAQSLSLVFGNPVQVAETLESLGLSFEIIGMLGKVLRLRGSNFRMIPNPTSDHWLKKTGQKASWKITRLMEVFQEKLAELAESEGFAPGHEVSNILDEWIAIRDLKYGDESNFKIEVREAIHDALDGRTTYLLHLKQLEVLSVLVAHVTEVIGVLDDPNSPLNSIVLANKEESLLSYYFYHIRPAVIGNLGLDNRPLSREEKEKRNMIWISLIFRMLCWLLLHDFDRADVMIVPSDLLGSRMPVYMNARRGKLIRYRAFLGEEFEIEVKVAIATP